MSWTYFNRWCYRKIEIIVRITLPVLRVIEYLIEVSSHYVSKLKTESKNTNRKNFACFQRANIIIKIFLHFHYMWVVWRKNISGR